MSDSTYAGKVWKHVGAGCVEEAAQHDAREGFVCTVRNLNTNVGDEVTLAIRFDILSSSPADVKPAGHARSC